MDFFAGVAAFFLFIFIIGLPAFWGASDETLKVWVYFLGGASLCFILYPVVRDKIEDIRFAVSCAQQERKRKALNREKQNIRHEIELLTGKITDLKGKLQSYGVSLKIVQLLGDCGSNVSNIKSSEAMQMVEELSGELSESEEKLMVARSRLKRLEAEKVE